MYSHVVACLCITQAKHLNLKAAAAAAAAAAASGAHQLRQP
jgi:hypothetical protein